MNLQQDSLRKSRIIIEKAKLRNKSMIENRPNKAQNSMATSYVEQAKYGYEEVPDFVSSNKRDSKMCRSENSRIFEHQ